MTMPEWFPTRPPEPDHAFGVPAGPDWTDRLDESLLRRGIVMVHGFLDASAATAVCARLMTLETTGEKPVTLHLRAPDAELEAAFAVVDTIDGLAAPVHATAVGEVGGPVLAILAAARRRQITPHAHLRLTEPNVRFEGTANDLTAHEQQYARLVDAFYFRLADVTGREVDELRADARARRFFAAAEAIDYGLVSSLAPGPAG